MSFSDLADLCLQLLSRNATLLLSSDRTVTLWLACFGGSWDSWELFSKSCNYIFRHLILLIPSLLIAFRLFQFFFEWSEHENWVHTPMTQYLTEIRANVTKHTHTPVIQYLAAIRVSVTRNTHVIQHLTEITVSVTKHTSENTWQKQELVLPNTHQWYNTWQK